MSNRLRKRLILASNSPRRAALLNSLGYHFDIIPSEIEESIHNDILPIDLVQFLAFLKARDVAQKVDNAIIIAADTIVVLGNQVINKPASRDEAIEMLQSLSGKEHRVITGVVLLKEDEEISFADITHVVFHQLSDEQIIFYVDKYKPYDKAGAYAIQEWIGVTGIKSINGDFYNVMGLPVSRVLQQLKHFTAVL